jgi:signal transduction histidine kinase
MLQTIEDTGRSCSTGRRAPRNDLFERTAHDLKNPLAVVRATLEWLELELGDRADALDAVHDASVAAERLLAIVDEFGILAQLETGRTVAADPVDVGAVVSEAVESTGGRLASRRISVVSTVAGPLTLAGDRPLLRRALEAFVDVCARSAPAGACIAIDARAQGNRLELAVGLRGVEGIAPPVASIELLASGGLGVVLALRVVEAHGGTVAVVPTATVPRVLVRLPL